MAVRDIEKIEGLTDAAPDTDIRKEVAKTVNKVSEATRKALAPIMGHGVADKVVREDTNAKADLEKFKKEIMTKPERAELTNDIRKDIHDKVLKVLGEGIVVGADTIKFKDATEAAKKFKETNEKAEKESKAKTESTAKTANEPEVDPGITTADSPPLSRRHAIAAGAVAAGVPLTVGGVAAASSWLGGGSFMGGLSNGVRSVGSLFAQPFRALGGPTLWNNLVVQPGNWLAGKLGLTTGAAATNSALAGAPWWLGTGVGALGVAGGVYAGSKLVNGLSRYAGKKMGYKPWKVPLIGNLWGIGTVANAAVAPVQLAANAGLKVFGAGKSAFNWMWGKGKEAAEHREGATHFGLGAAAGAGILAGLTGGSALVLGLVGGHLARKGLKGKHLSDLIPAPFGVRKSEAGGEAHHT